MKGFGEIKKKTQKEIDKSKKNSKKLADLALKSQINGNIAEAIRYYEEFINKGFQNEVVFNNYGVILEQLGKFNKAEIITRKAIGINPKLADSHYNLGGILSNLGRYNEAVTAFFNAIELNPNLVEAYFNLGNTYRALGRLEDAEKLFCETIKLRPNFVDAHLNLGLILKDLSRLEEAEISILRAIENKSDNADAYSSLAEIYKLRCKNKKAIACYEKTLEIRPWSIVGVYGLNQSREIESSS